MYCKNCGNELTDSDRFCGRCGYSTTMSPKRTEESKRTKKKVYKIVVAVLGATCIIFTLILIDSKFNLINFTRNGLNSGYVSNRMDTATQSENADNVTNSTLTFDTKLENTPVIEKSTTAPKSPTVQPQKPLEVEVVSADRLNLTKNCTKQYCMVDGVHKFIADIPEIKSNLPGAAELNKQLRESITEDQDEVLGENGGEKKITYQVIKDQEILNIICYFVRIGCESGEGPRRYEIYHYNMITDKVLDNTAYAQYYGFTLENIKETAKKYYAKIQGTQDWTNDQEYALGSQTFYLENGKIYYIFKSGLGWDELVRLG